MISTVAALRLANAIEEAHLREQKARREAEREAAVRANSRDYQIDAESQAALERGDRQRETGINQTIFDPDQWCHETLDCPVKSLPDSNGFHICGREAGHPGKHECVSSEFCGVEW